METSIRLGDVTVPRMGLGTNHLDYNDENVSFVKDVVGAGIRHIDTAYRYRNGESETTIGAALSPFAPDMVVATKAGISDGGGRPEVLTAEIDESLKRLQTDTIALHYLHRVDANVPVEESLGALKEAQDAGKIRHIGISEVGVDLLERARAVVEIAAVQNHYSIVERKWDDVVDYCERESIVFVPYFPLRGETPAAVDEIAAQRGATASQIKLAWLLRRSPVTLPIPGTLNAAHAKENLAALETELSDEEFEALSRSVSRGGDL
ncbi:MAG: aldo/keto reductase [Acidimicrobiia bacterium]|nr:aldo/keto reductase [Acidimicrobiia bacterium]MBV9041050.1 aldo/keto reductase [Acidimicrobiia bacterium]